MHHPDIIKIHAIAKTKANTLLSEASDTKRNVIALLSDDAVMHAMHYLADNCLQFQLYPFWFVHFVIVLGFWVMTL